MHGNSPEMASKAVIDRPAPSSGFRNPLKTDFSFSPAPTSTAPTGAGQQGQQWRQGHGEVSWVTL